MAEPRTAAAVIDLGGTAGVLQRARAAALVAMLESRQRGDVGNALASRRGSARRTADFPQSRLDLGKRRRLPGCSQGQRGGTCREEEGQPASHFSLALSRGR